jgi:hypothetical protein
MIANDVVMINWCSKFASMNYRKCTAVVYDADGKPYVSLYVQRLSKKATVGQTKCTYTDLSLLRPFC